MKLRLLVAAIIMAASTTAVADEPDPNTLEQKLIRAFDEQKPAFAACNEVAEVATTVRVKFAISPDGSVEILEASAEDDAPKAVACIRDVYANARYEGLPIEKPLPVTKSHCISKPTKFEGIDLDDE